MGGIDASPGGWAFIMLAFDGDTFPFIGLACVQVKEGRCPCLWLFFLRSFLLILFFVFLFFSIRVLSFYAYYPLCMYVFTYIYLLLVSYDLLFFTRIFYIICFVYILHFFVSYFLGILYILFFSTSSSRISFRLSRLLSPPSSLETRLTFIVKSWCFGITCNIF